jgi:hypothetical protein
VQLIHISFQKTPKYTSEGMTQVVEHLSPIPLPERDGDGEGKREARGEGERKRGKEEKE